MSDQELLSRSCHEPSCFPVNVIHSQLSRHQLKNYAYLLNQHAERLFCQDGKAELNVLEMDNTTREFKNRCFSSVLELKARLEGEYLYVHDDPWHRFAFIHAPNSRERLRISEQMAKYMFTYHQVMPNFLDFVFPFGHQLYPEDFYFSGFREDSRLYASDKGLQIPDLGRSGKDIRMCYSLKSVEPYKKESWPWAVRQTALYHSFDLVTGKTFCAIVKGSQLMKDRIEELISEFPNPQDGLDTDSIHSISGSFSLTLETHLVLGDWCSENWRWYLVFLEKRLQMLTRHLQAVKLHKAASFVEPVFTPTPIKRSTGSIVQTLADISRRTFSASKRTGTLNEKSEYQAPFPQPLIPPTILTTSPPMSPIAEYPAQNNSLQVTGAATADRSSDEYFSAEKLQQIQYIEAKVSEVLLVLESNIKVINGIKSHYQSILASDCCPVDTSKNSTKRAIAAFHKRMSNIVEDLESQLASAKTLLRLIENRSTLFSGLLNHRTIEASKDLGTKSQVSAIKMEAMTAAMHHLTVRTTQETVSMKVITLVTLLFLPGTFISTIMSTDIIRFPSEVQSGRVFQLDALQTYLETTIPLTILTFAGWWIIYKYINRRQEQSYPLKPGFQGNILPI